MLNLLKKTKPWMVASLFVASSVFGQDANSCGKQSCPPKPCPKPCPQPCPPTQMCEQDPCCPPWPTPVLNAAYNYPARTQTRCPWDIFVDASFIYWQPLQDNMEVGFLSTDTFSINTPGYEGKFVNLDTDFKPGFKVGLGGYFDYDNWDLALHYTWFHGSQSQSINAPNDLIFPTWGVPSLMAGLTPYTQASEKWNLKMDLLQLDLGRYHYVGTKLKAHPYFGARAAWIRQNADVTYTLTGTDVAAISAKTRNWGIGPEVGMDTEFDLGMGFRFFGCAEADVLFTKFTKSSYSESHTVDSTYVRTKQNRINTVRTHLDLEMGFGWGTYIDCNNWYLDFAAGYGFQVFFDQNMFRKFVGGDTGGAELMLSTNPNGNLYVHGLTLTMKLDF